MQSFSKRDAEASPRELIDAPFGVSLLKLTAGSNLYPAVAETRWLNFAAARCSGLCLYVDWQSY
jgi:hypothetical protein